MEGGTRDAPDRVSTSVFWPILPPWSSLLPPPPPPPPPPLPLPSPIPPCVLGQQPQPPPPYSPPPPHSHEHMRVSSSAASIISCNMLDSELQPTCERHRQVHPARSVQACMRVRAHAEGSPDLLNGRRCCPEDKGTALSLEVRLHRQGQANLLAGPRVFSRLLPVSPVEPWPGEMI
jgi:hypothetical protein